MSRNLYRASIAIGAFVLASAAVLPTALAHAAYESSDPANGSSVSSPPSRITAEFTEPVTEDSRLQVFDPCGTQVDNGDSLIAADRITVTMSGDKQGTYTVNFGVISAVDAHPTNGSFTFTSTSGEFCPGEEPVEEEPAGGGSGGGSASGSAGAGGGSGGSGSGGSGSSGARSSTATDGGSSAGTGSGNGGRGSSGEGRTRDDSLNLGRDRGDRAGTGTMGEMEHSGGVALGTTTTSASEGTDVWDGVPMIPFVVAMFVAAVMGGAGGLVYANILPPPRRKDTGFPS